MKNHKFFKVIKKALKITKKFIYLFVFKIRASFYKTKVLKNNDTKKIVLFFLPELAVTLYLDMLIKVAGDVQRSGYTPVFFGCNGSLSNCILMDRTDRRSRTIKNSILCADCSLGGMSRVINENFDYLKCNNEKNNTFAFIGNSVDERLRYSYKGIPIGRLAYYDLSIKFKRDRARINLSDKETIYYDSIISDGISIVDFLDKNPISKVSDAVIAIDEYSLANIVREWARQNNMSAFRAGFSYHFNADPQFVTLSTNKTRAGEKSKRAEAWKAWRNIPLPPMIAKEIASDLVFRMSGTGGHIFSLNYSGELEKFITDYNLRLNLRTLVVFTSANDEIDALAELSQALGDKFEIRDAFENQLDWIKYIIDYANNNAVQVIIKMHPRLSKSHRDSGMAEDIPLYKKLSDSAPSNVIFIWPEDKVSAYDILQLADICLTSWGTMGLEAAKLGVPVVSGITRITFATPQLALFLKAETLDQFYEMITQPLEVVSLEDITEAFRWHHLLHISGSILVSGDRDINLYTQAFNLSFSDVLQGLNIADEKYKFLMEQVESNGNVATDLEFVAMNDALDSLIQFFEKVEISKTPHSKLLARLKLISRTCDSNIAKIVD